MVSPWFDPDQWKGGTTPSTRPNVVFDSPLDVALEVPPVVDEKGFRIRPRPSSPEW